ncbi:MAG: SHOCT domain-containing protein [Actinomycetes bacterium]
MFSLGDVIVSIFWFMLLFAWIWLLIAILSDIFRDRELSGWGKALWTLFLIVVPWLGALVYLIARGASMNERNQQEMERRQALYHPSAVHPAASTASTADELAKLGDLRDRGALTTEEYERAKAKVLA